MSNSLVDSAGPGDIDALAVQYVSDPIIAQTIAAQTIKLEIGNYEYHSDNNQFIALAVKVVSNDGSTVRGTILALTRDATEMSAIQSARYLSATTSEVVAQDGDRLVFEIGAGGNPTLPSGGYRFYVRLGDNGSSDISSGSDGLFSASYNPWIEFTNNISFA